MKRKGAPRRAVIGYVILSVAIVLGLYRGHETDIHLCRAQQENRTTLRVILVRAQYAATHNTFYSPAQREAAVKFYRDILRDIPEHINC